MPRARLLAIPAALLLLAIVRPAASEEPRQAAPSNVPSQGVRGLTEALEAEEAAGLSLDAAIERLIAANYELATKYQDIPKARADILSARLIGNPSVFLNAGGIPYGSYSPRRPGETEYEMTAVQPFDISGKRRGRIRVAQRAEQVLEALYQDAVRKKIDELGTAYVDVLEARLNAHAAQITLTWLTNVQKATRDLAGQGIRSRSEVTETTVRQAQAGIAREKAAARLLQARRQLAVLLALPCEQADELRLQGSLRDLAPCPPDMEELLDLAVQARPDLAAHRLSIERALADVRLIRSERFEDILVFYTPYQVTTFPSQPEKAATGWETGALGVVPLFDRKQGELTRAQVNVTQIQMQTQALHRTILQQVRSAATEYALSREMVQRYEQEVLPKAHEHRENTYRRFVWGQESLDALLETQKDYQQATDRYVHALARHRRSMLKLNTAIGQRMLP